jgi:hypothetical protein
MTQATQDTKSLSATLELSPSGDDWSIAFTLRNPTDKAIDTETTEPFLDFALDVRAGDTKLPITQPALDIPVRDVTLHFAPGESKRLVTPIRLRFDPDVPPSGGHDRFVWSIESARVPVVVKATITLAGLAPIEAQTTLE